MSIRLLIHSLLISIMLKQAIAHLQHRPHLLVPLARTREHWGNHGESPASIGFSARYLLLAEWFAVARIKFRARQRTRRPCTVLNFRILTLLPHLSEISRSVANFTKSFLLTFKLISY